MTEEWDGWLASIKKDDLPRFWARVMRELRDRGITRSANNPVADIGEYLAANQLGLELAAKVAQGYDATGPDGERYQVKSRRLTPQNKSRQMGIIHKLDQREFEFVVAVVFDEHLTLLDMWKIPYDAIVEHSRWVATLNGHRFWAKPPLTTDPRVIQVA